MQTRHALTCPQSRWQESPFAQAAFLWLPPPFFLPCSSTLGLFFLPSPPSDTTKRKEDFVRRDKSQLLGLKDSGMPTVQGGTPRATSQEPFLCTHEAHNTYFLLYLDILVPAPHTHTLPKDLRALLRTLRRSCRSFTFVQQHPFQLVLCCYWFHAPSEDTHCLLRSWGFFFLLCFLF